MRWLLDTHCWIWAMQEPERLNARVRQHIEDPSQELFISAASAWEMAIKAGLGRLKLPGSVAEYVESRLREEKISELPISARHAARIQSLPHHHRDPFDRILIAQAQCENLALVTANRLFKKYDLSIIRAD